MASSIELLRVRRQRAAVPIQRGEIGAQPRDVAARAQHARVVVVAQLLAGRLLDRDIAAVAIEQGQRDADAETVAVYGAGIARGIEPDVQRGKLDRKSTRLNSSH